MSISGAEENPFASNPFGDVSNFNIDDDEEELAPPMLTWTPDEITDLVENAPNMTPDILMTRPTERENLALMTPEEISSELGAYSCKGLSYLSENTRRELLEGLRSQQDITEYQTVGAMTQNGEILPPELTKNCNELQTLHFNTDALTPDEIKKIHDFAKWEDTTEVLEIIRDMTTQARNLVSRRRENPPEVDEIAEKIDNYLNGSTDEADPEYVSSFERQQLAEIWGDMEEFSNLTRSELQELGYLDEEGSVVKVGPLTESDLNTLEGFIRPSYADMLSHVSAKHFSEHNPNAIFVPKVRDSSVLYDASLYYYAEKHVERERLYKPKALIGGFVALASDFFASSLTKDIKGALSKTPNDNISKTLSTLRLSLMQGARICNLLTRGSDSEAQAKYGSKISVNPEHLKEILEKAENLSEFQQENIMRNQYEFMEKLTDYFDACRVSYDSLQEMLQYLNASANSEGEGETNADILAENALENKERPAVSLTGTKKLLDLYVEQQLDYNSVENLDFENKE